MVAGKALESIGADGGDDEWTPVGARQTAHSSLDPLHDHRISGSGSRFWLYAREEEEDYDDVGLSVIHFLGLFLGHSFGC